jgi:hypothetical protein
MDARIASKETHTLIRNASRAFASPREHSRDVTVDATVNVTSLLTRKNRNEINESAMRTHTNRNAFAIPPYLLSACFLSFETTVSRRFL